MTHDEIIAAAEVVQFIRDTEADIQRSQTQIDDARYKLALLMGEVPEVVAVPCDMTADDVRAHGLHVQEPADIRQTRALVCAGECVGRAVEIYQGMGCSTIFHIGAADNRRVDSFAAAVEAAQREAWEAQQ